MRQFSADARTRACSRVHATGMQQMRVDSTCPVRRGALKTGRACHTRAARTRTQRQTRIPTQECMLLSMPPDHSGQNRWRAGKKPGWRGRAMHADAKRRTRKAGNTIPLVCLIPAPGGSGPCARPSPAASACGWTITGTDDRKHSRRAHVHARTPAHAPPARALNNAVQAHLDPQVPVLAAVHRVRQFLNI